MFFDQSFINGTAFSESDGDIAQRYKYVILGRFNPVCGSPTPARQIATRIAETGDNIITASIAPTPALVSLRFRSRKLWAATLNEVDRITKDPFTAIIYPSGLGFDAIDKPRWSNRRMEEWRRLRLASILIARSQRSFLMLGAEYRHNPLWVLIVLAALIRILSIHRGSIIWAKDASNRLANILTGVSLPPPPTSRTQKNVMQIRGIGGGESGLARNTLMSIEAFELAGIATDMSVSPAKHQLNRSVTLHHVNADQIPNQIRRRDQSFNIGFLLWELEVLPRSHLQAGKLLDEVWVPSKYVQQIYERAYNCPVVNIGKGISLPDVKASELSDYDLNNYHHLVLMCFDAHSSVERKNPLAAVQAFLSAFPNTPNARLIIKAAPTGPNHWGDPNHQMHQIKAIAHGDPRIIVDERVLPFSALLALIKRADCVVSPHRAEGFGYIPAYALSYARPVIITDYSGTQEYCNVTTSYPIPYKMVNARKGETITQLENATWADIDVDALANAMREVRDEPLQAQIKALRGQQLIRSRFTPQMQATRYLERLRKLGVLEG